MATYGQPPAPYTNSAPVPYSGFPQPQYTGSTGDSRRRSYMLLGVFGVLMVALIVIIVVLVASPSSPSQQPNEEPIISAKCTKTCSGHGTCVLKGTVQTCSCKTGYSGSACQSLVEEPPSDLCAAVTCENDGTCNSETGACDCAEGFSGETCSEQQPPADACAKVSCKNGGSCNPDTGKCVCVGGYTGSTCNVAPTTQCTKTCSGHGTCVLTGTVQTCSCNSGYSGSSCQSQITTDPPVDACAKITCLNNGKCSAGKCSCVDGYTGDTCATAPVNTTDPCAKINCLNGGKCSAGKCTCVNGYTGDLCATAPVVVTPNTTVTCPATKLAAGDTTKQTAGGRAYILHVPSAYKGDSAVPLIIDFHPIGGSASQWRSGSPYPKVVDSEGVITVFPDGKSGPMGQAWNVEGCCVDNVDDVQFARDIVTEVSKIACINPKRIYAVGFSMGGGMTHYAACHASDIFAAGSPAAFDLLKENINGCKPTRPLTMIIFRGTADSIVPYNGGLSQVVSGHPINFLGAVESMKRWAAFNKCEASATDLGGNCQGYSKCDGGVEVQLCTKQGGGHEAGDAAKAWPILKKYTLP